MLSRKPFLASPSIALVMGAQAAVAASAAANAGTDVSSTHVSTTQEPPTQEPAVVYVCLNGCKPETEPHHTAAMHLMDSSGVLQSTAADGRPRCAQCHDKLIREKDFIKLHSIRKGARIQPPNDKKNENAESYRKLLNKIGTSKLIPYEYEWLETYNARRGSFMSNMFSRSAELARSRQDEIDRVANDKFFEKGPKS